MTTTAANALVTLTTQLVFVCEFKRRSGGAGKS